MSPRLITYGPIKGYAKNGGTGLLPTQQLICLMGLAQGKSHEEIGRDQNLSPNSVSKTIQRAYDKLSDYPAGLIVRTAAHAVFEAMKRGIIAPLMILLALAGPLMTEDDLRRPNPPRIPRPAARASARARGRRREDWLDWEGLS